MNIKIIIIIIIIFLRGEEDGFCSVFPSIIFSVFIIHIAVCFLLLSSVPKSFYSRSELFFLYRGYYELSNYVYESRNWLLLMGERIFKVIVKHLFCFFFFILICILFFASCSLLIKYRHVVERFCYK